MTAPARQALGTHHLAVICSDDGRARACSILQQSGVAGAGLTLAHVVQVRSDVDDPADLGEYSRLYREYFTPPFPSRTTTVSGLGGAIKFEVDVVAYSG